MPKPSPSLTIKVAALLAALLAALAPGRAETFGRGRAAYRTTGGAWASAVIEVSMGRLEIHALRGQRQQLVGAFSFEEAEGGGKTVSVERQAGVRRRTGAGVKAGIIGGAIVGGLWAGLKPALTKIARAKGAREADIRQVEQDYWDKYAPKAFGAALGVVATVALVKGLRKTQGDPYWRVSEASEQGRRSLEIRVSRKDIARFEQALMNNRLGSF